MHPQPLKSNLERKRNILMVQSVRMKAIAGGGSALPSGYQQ